MTSNEYFKNIIKLLADVACSEGYIEDELVMVPELDEASRSYAMSWLKDNIK